MGKRRSASRRAAGAQAEEKCMKAQEKIASFFSPSSKGPLFVGPLAEWPTSPGQESTTAVGPNDVAVDLASASEYNEFDAVFADTAPSEVATEPPDVPITSMPSTLQADEGASAKETRL
jgi:hypothetical protein